MKLIESKDWLRKVCRRNRYPHDVFARAIAARLRNRRELVRGLIVDVPCGSGEFAIQLARMLDCPVRGVDLSPEFIMNAASLAGSEEVRFEVGNIYEYLAAASGIDILCIINSLPCLPDVNRVMELAFKAVKPNGVAFIIQPNFQSENYKVFHRQFPEVTRLALSKDETGPFFETFGFQAKLVTGLARARRYGRRLNWMKSFRYVYLSLENFILEAFGGGESSYFLFELNKTVGAASALAIRK
jgi:SAM-dependent methyltransferase